MRCKLCAETAGHGYTPLTDGWPSGRVGLYTTVANVKFDYTRIYPDQQTRDLAGRWTATSTSAINSSSRLQLGSSTGEIVRPVLLKNLRLEKFQIVFAIRREAGASSSDVSLVFAAGDQDHYTALRFRHSNSATAPYGYLIDGSGTEGLMDFTSAANLPTVATGSDPLWVRVICDGSTLKARAIAQSGEPSGGDWSGASDKYVTDFDSSGMLGFICTSGTASVDDVTIKSYNSGNSSFDITEAKETFAVDGSGYASETPTYDLNGNLTYDGLQQYTYDAWNRMRTAAHAYRDSSVYAGQTLDTMSYDGKGRRIKKVTSGTGEWDLTNQYYFDHDSVIEKRNGSDVPITQYVWGTRYIDELCQLLVESADNVADTLTDSDDSVYYACQDSNYNVLGIVDASAVLTERYTYTPYGQRKVFIASGANDVGDYLPMMNSQRIATAETPEPYPTCDIGHQGLMHDEEIGLVYNRARMLVPEYGRFGGRDPREYVDGPNMLSYVRTNPAKLHDPSGTQVPPWWLRCGCPPKTAKQICDEAQIIDSRVVCYCGQQYPCAPDSGHPGPDPADMTADRIGKQCALLHENTHISNGDQTCEGIDPMKPSTAKWRPGMTQREKDCAECASYGPHVDCLITAQVSGECTSPQCESDLQKIIDATMTKLNKYCGKCHGHD